VKGDKRERIIRVLLNDPVGSLSKYRIAKNAGTSISWTIEYLQSLETMGLIKKTEVRKFEELIDIWLKMSRKPRYFDFFINDPKAFLNTINMEYALTTYLADTFTNSILFPSRADVYIRKADFEMWKGLLLKDGLIGKGNFRLLLGDDHVFYNKINVRGYWIVSPPQLMLDLKREGGVCMEAYDVMVKKNVR
jgi:hypothetical protein